MCAFISSLVTCNGRWGWLNLAPGARRALPFPASFLAGLCGSSGALYTGCALISVHNMGWPFLDKGRFLSLFGSPPESHDSFSTTMMPNKGQKLIVQGTTGDGRGRQGTTRDDKGRQGTSQSTAPRTPLFQGEYSEIQQTIHLPTLPCPPRRRPTIGPSQKRAGMAR